MLGTPQRGKRSSRDGYNIQVRDAGSWARAGVIVEFCIYFKGKAYRICY